VTGALSVQPDGRSGAWFWAIAGGQIDANATRAMMERWRMAVLWLVESDILARM
jgi:hypothetical protein